jgi:hypothetical protein
VKHSLIFISLVVSASLAGCVGPITQSQCEFLAHDAIHAIQKRDTAKLAKVMSDPDDAARKMQELADIMPDGLIWCRGEFYLFPTPTYSRFYTVYPKTKSNRPNGQPLYLEVSYCDRPLRIVGLSLQEIARK